MLVLATGPLLPALRGLGRLLGRAAPRRHAPAAGSLGAMRIALPAMPLAAPGEALIRLVPVRRRPGTARGGLLLAGRVVPAASGAVLEASGWARAGRYCIAPDPAAEPLAAPVIRIGVHGRVRVVAVAAPPRPALGAWLGALLARLRAA